MTFQSPILTKFIPLRLDKYNMERNLGNGVRPHHGVDLRSANRTIIASADGVVSRNEFHPNGFGHVVYIKHGEWETRYAHLAGKSPLKIGQAVKAGDNVGIMGTSGNSKGVHLHFEIRKNGNSKNPEDFIDFLNRKPKKENPTNDTNLKNNNMPNFTIPRSEAIADIEKRNFDTATKNALKNAVYDNNFSYIITYAGEKPRTWLKSSSEQVETIIRSGKAIKEEKSGLEKTIEELKNQLKQQEERFLKSEEELEKRLVKGIENTEIKIEDRIQEEKRNQDAENAKLKEAEKDITMSLEERNKQDVFADLAKLFIPTTVGGSVLFNNLDLGVLSDNLNGGTLGVLGAIVVTLGNAIISYQVDSAKNKRKMEEKKKINKIANV